MRIPFARSEMFLAVFVVTFIGVEGNSFGQSNGLVAAYGLNEGSGNVVSDLSENGNEGTLSGATWTTAGKYSNALTFNGLDSLVTVNDSASLDLTTGMTLEAWVYPTSASGTWASIAMKVASGDLVYVISTDPGNHPNCSVYADNQGVQTVTGPQVLALNVWIHLAATYDGTTLRLFANGLEVASGFVGGNIVTSDGALCIGGNSVWGEYFTGKIDEVRIYDRALTGAEIQTDMVTPVGVGLPPDTQSPTAPQNLTAVASSASQIDLNWKASTDNVGVTGYQVERQDPGNANFVTIGSATGTSFSNAGLVTGNAYLYRVRATDAAGNLSLYSSVANATAMQARAGGLPGFQTESHVAKDGIGVAYDGATVSIDITGENTLLLAAWHAEFDGGAPNGWRAECNGVSGKLLTDTNGYVGGDGNRRFRIYYWANPTPGAKTILVTNDFSVSDNELAVAAILLTNVAPANPIRAVALDVSTNPRTTESETVATTTSDLVVHVIGYALVTQGTLGNGETSRSIANDGKHAPLGDASLWVSTKPGSMSNTTVSSSGWASRVLNGVAIVVHGVEPPGGLSISISNDVAHITGTGEAGFTYTIQASSDLARWQNLGTATADGSGAFQFPDPIALDSVARFYRATLP